MFLVAGDLGGCWELVSSGLFCVSFLGGFSGGSCRGKKEFDAGRLTSSISSSDYWLSFDAGMAALFFVLSLNLSSISSREVWLDVLVDSGGSCIVSPRALIWSLRKVISASSWFCFLLMVALFCDIFAFFFWSA